MANSVVGQKGRNFLIKVSDGTSPTAYVTLGGLRSTQIVINGGAVDISNKGSGGWREMLPGAGVKSIDLTGDGVYDSSSAQFRALQNAVLNDQLVQMEVISGGGDAYQGTWSIDSITRTGNHDNAEMYQLKISSSGFPTYSSTPSQQNVTL